MRLLLICSLSMLLFTISCKDHTTPKPAEKEAPVPSMPTPPKKEIPKTSTFGKLQGKWQSTEDPKSFLIFEGTKRIHGYQSQKADTTSFKLAANCNDERASYSEIKTLYILSDERCWSIDALNAEHLELTYMERGNILTYKKVLNKIETR